MTKVLAVLEYPKVNYFKENASGQYDFTFLTTPAGKLFNKIITAPKAGLGLNLADVDITFAYGSIPKVYKDGSYADVSKKSGEPYFEKLREEINDKNPDLILAFGNTSCLALLGKKGINSLRGTPVSVKVKEANYEVVPLLNPEELMVSPNKRILMKSDIKLIKRYLKFGEQGLKPQVGKYELVTDFGRVKQIFMNLLGLPPLKKPMYNIVAVDTETNTLETWRKGAKPIILSLSWKVGQGVCIPLRHKLAPDLWSDEEFDKIHDWILDLFQSDMYKVLHNGKFDIRMLMDTYGLPKAVNCVDSLIMFWLSVTEENTVKKGLKDLAWFYTDMGGYEEPLDKFKEEYLQSDYDNWYAKEEKRLVEEAKNNPLKSGKPRKPKKPAKKNYPGLTNEIDGGKFNYEWIPLNIIYPYAAGDTDACLRIFYALLPKIKENADWVNLVFNIYPKLNDVLCQMEHNGLQIDNKQADKLVDVYSKRKEDILEDIYKLVPEIKEIEKERVTKLAKREQLKLIKKSDRTDDEQKFIEKYAKYQGVNNKTGEPKYKLNLESPNDLGYLLYDVLGYELPPEPNYLTDKTVKLRVSKDKLTYKNYRTNKEAIEYIRDNYDEVLGEKLLDLSKTSTALSNFILKLPNLQDSNGRIHTGFNPTGTVTSRLSSSGAYNAQQLQRRESDPSKFNYKYSVKSMIHSRFKGGVIANLDFKSLEVYIMALISKDHSLTQVLLNNEDVHKHNASVAFGVPEDEVTKDLRTTAKAVTFGLLYGESAQGMATKQGISLAEAQETIDKVLGGMPGVKAFIDETHAKVEKLHYVETITGFRRRLGDVLSKDKGKASRALRQSVNAIIQGSGSNILVLGLIKAREMFEKYHLKSVLAITVHDSIVIDCHPDEVEKAIAIVKYCMEHVDLPILTNNDATGYDVPEQYRLPNNKFRFPLRAEPEIGLNYNDDVAFEKEEFEKFNSPTGYCKYQYAMTNLDELLEYNLEDEETVARKKKELESKKQIFEQF